MGVLCIVSPWLCTRSSYSSWSFYRPFPLESLMSSSNCIIMSFSFLLILMSASLTLIISHIARACLMSIQVETFYISFVDWFPFFWGGDFPPSVIILHRCPCIEHRYVPLVGTSFFSPWHSSPPRFVTIKHFYSFSSFSKYLKKSKKKIKIPKSWIGKDVIFGNSRVMSPSNRALYITSIGWVNSLTLGDILVSLILSPMTS